MIELEHNQKNLTKLSSNKRTNKISEDDIRNKTFFYLYIFITCFLFYSSIFFKTKN